MFKENLHSETEEDETGSDVGGALGNGDVALAKVDTHEGDCKGDGTDEGHNPEDGGQRVVQSEADANGEGVDAGGNAEKEEIEN